MTHADTDTEPLFSPEDGLDELWVKAYQGEVSGEIVFGAPATFGDPTDIAAFEASCGGNLTLTSTQVAVFDPGSALNDLEAA